MRSSGALLPSMTNSGSDLKVLHGTVGPGAAGRRVQFRSQSLFEPRGQTLFLEVQTDLHRQFAYDAIGQTMYDACASLP